MALTDRKLTVAYASKIDQLLDQLPEADSEWLLGHLTTKDGRGNYPASGRWLSDQLKDENPDYEVSRSTIDEWRRKNLSP